MAEHSSSAQPPSPALHSPAYWARVWREASQYRWSKAGVGGPSMCLPVIAAWLHFGITRGHRQWAVFAVAGAVSASFGAFQKLGQGRVKPMVAVLAGIAAFTWAGNVAGYLGWQVWVVAATVCGFGFGVMTALGYGGWWIGLQWMIALLVYGAHAARPAEAGLNALAVAAGGASQVLFLTATRPFSERWFTSQDQPPWDPVDSLGDTLAMHAHPATSAGTYALRVAAAMAVSTVIWHYWGLPNGYWTPMTVAILLKPDFHESTIRGVNRLTGTLAGAGLMTIVLAVVRPGPGLLAGLLLMAIWGCLALMRVNYALFVACATMYVVLLFSILGLPEPVVALHRVQATLAGFAVALLASLFPLGSHRSVALDAVGGGAGPSAANAVAAAGTDAGPAHPDSDAAIV
jgi:hypothetical protein